MIEGYHTPVLLAEAIELLQIKPEGIYVDATLGGGGYSEAILRQLTHGRVYGFDTDPAAQMQSQKRLKEYAARFQGVSENFAELQSALAERGVEKIEGIVFDLGVSSHQLDTDSIGLSYRIDAPLDMRLDPRLPLNARDIVERSGADELLQIFRSYGEEPFAGKFARRIVERRATKPITTTLELADLIREGIREDKRNATLSRIFQALRIAVNHELQNLELGLDQAIELLKPGGRIVVVSYHSLEDRIVKRRFQVASAPKSDPTSASFFKDAVDWQRATLRMIGKQPIVPSEAEVQRNVRARSAKLRAAEKL